LYKLETKKARKNEPLAILIWIKEDILTTVNIFEGGLVYD